MKRPETGEEPERETETEIVRGEYLETDEDGSRAGWRQSRRGGALTFTQRREDSRVGVRHLKLREQTQPLVLRNRDKTANPDSEMQFTFHCCCTYLHTVDRYTSHGGINKMGHLVLRPQ